MNWYIVHQYDRRRDFLYDVIGPFDDEAGAVLFRDEFLPGREIATSMTPEEVIIEQEKRL